ncbi:MBL fold metallo-hydrolase [Streptosporangium roseum]|uniref:MBL fold metallo-hydrolase n=1 Tax=Streptosporangium roseum TaxID=2001 RepID=UPI0009DEDC1B|nr:MBL fold metallo-hydrolase [Streptosporangium roseum]
MGRSTQPVVFTSGAPEPRSLDVRWIHGSPSAKHNTDPDIQVHAYDEHTFILRQNMAINYEAPFLFLMFGSTRAVLIDTGATASAEFFPLRRVVDDLIGRWLAGHPRDGYTLLVLHTHAHRDHIAGDGQFSDRPDTVVVGADLNSSRKYFGFSDDLGRTAQIDLGDRVLECLATPGHHEAAVTFYDPHTGFLLTGDTVYPGRLYVEDWSAFGRTVDRLIEFAGTRPVTHVLGCHIEMTGEPGVDYPVLTTYQPDEPPLQMTVGQLRDIREAIDAIGDRPGRHAFPDFIICRTDTVQGPGGAVADPPLTPVRDSSRVAAGHAPTAGRRGRR